MGLSIKPVQHMYVFQTPRFLLRIKVCLLEADPEISMQGRAKTALILFTVALTSKLCKKHVDSISLHPGCKYLPARRSQGHSDGAAAIKTNLQTYMTPEMREEAVKTIETNTGRKRIDSFRPLSSPSTWGSKMISDLSFC